MASCWCRIYVCAFFYISTCGLVATTSASHAGGRQFDPGQVYFTPDSLRGSSVKMGTIQRRLAWPPRTDDTHTSRSVNNHLLSLQIKQAMGTHTHTHTHTRTHPRGPGFNSRSGPSAQHACSIVCGLLAYGCVVATAGWGAVIKTLCPSGLRGWTQVPLARAAWVQIPQVSHVPLRVPLRTRLPNAKATC